MLKPGYRVTLSIIGMALVIAACQPAAPVSIPTLASLPSLTPTLPPTSTPVGVVAAPSATPRPVQTWYAAGADLIPVYDCADLTCGVVATFDNGDPVDSYGVKGEWHEVRLADGSSGYVPTDYLHETPRTDMPTATDTASATMTGTATQPPTSTLTATSSRTPRSTVTATVTPTVRTPFPTLPLVGPSTTVPPSGSAIIPVATLGILAPNPGANPTAVLQPAAATPIVPTPPGAGDRGELTAPAPPGAQPPPVVQNTGEPPTSSGPPPPPPPPPGA